ncbi:MAG: hypothetical protein NTY03_02785 [Candidatus Bathyarchaeota archaeon]|nr:hypothetical protein [Candidatus Bathyarchaeota archaeon]
MSQSKDTFTAGKIRDLVHYGQTVIFETVRAALRSNDEEFEAIKLGMLRRNARLSIFPELILEEMPSEEVKSCSSLSIECREALFELIGNRSRAVVSMNDGELRKMVGEKLRKYT